MKSQIKLIIFILCISSFYCNSLIFPFKKLTIEYLDQKKTINDFLNYAIYTNITMGTPPRTVAHFFLDGKQDTFSYGYMQIQYHGTTEFNEKEKKIENALKLFYNYTNSSTYKSEDKYYNIYSDYYFLYDLNGTEYNVSLKFNIVSFILKKTYGIFDLFSKKSYRIESIYLLPMLQEKNLTSGCYITFNYKENYTYLDDDYSKTLGNLILGEPPHEFNPEIYSKDDEIQFNMTYNLDEDDYYLEIDEIRLTNFSNYTENSAQIYINFHNGFINGNPAYQKNVEQLFFSDLISRKFCKVDFIEENLDITQYFVYSCVNNEYMQEKIKHFPTLYLDINKYNLTFLFNYQELFQIYNNRLYFLIMFQNKTFSTWDFGELFLRKYLTSFNYNLKSISFYKSQIDDINAKTDIEIEPDDSDDTDEYITDAPITDETDIPTDPTDNITDIPITDSSSDSSTVTDKNKDNEDDDNYTTKIVIIIIVVILALGIIVIAIIYLIKYKRKQKEDEINKDFGSAPDEKNKLFISTKVIKN